VQGAEVSKEDFEMEIVPNCLDVGQIPIENGVGDEKISTKASIGQLSGKSRLNRLLTN